MSVLESDAEAAKVGTTTSFCPVCQHMLSVSADARDAGAPALVLACRACAYEYKLSAADTVRWSGATWHALADARARARSLRRPRRERRDDVLGGDDAWANVDQTEAVCPKCAHNRAYYMLIQTRSADEPTSEFYKCVSCGERWRQG